MKEVEYFTFMLPPDIWRKKPHPSAFKMDMAYAARVYPGSTPILNTREVRSLPSTPEELVNASRTYPDSKGPFSPVVHAKVLQDYEARLQREKQAAERGVPPP
jgi:hypothetical protein